MSPKNPKATSPAAEVEAAILACLPTHSSFDHKVHAQIDRGHLTQERSAHASWRDIMKLRKRLLDWQGARPEDFVKPIQGPELPSRETIGGAWVVATYGLKSKHFPAKFQHVFDSLGFPNISKEDGDRIFDKNWPAFWVLPQDKTALSWKGWRSRFTIEGWDCTNPDHWTPPDNLDLDPVTVDPKECAQARVTTAEQHQTSEAAAGPPGVMDQDSKAKGKKRVAEDDEVDKDTLHLAKSFKALSSGPTVLELHQLITDLTSRVDKLNKKATGLEDIIDNRVGKLASFGCVATPWSMERWKEHEKLCARVKTLETGR